MNRNFPSSIRAVLLLLILVIGPVQAQSMFACEIMDEVMHSECCCVEHKLGEDCANTNCDGALNFNDGPCCERSVELSLDDEARQDTPIFKPAYVHTDVDPPTAIVASFDVVKSLQKRVVVRVSVSLPNVSHSGSDIYLITQRLRI